MQTFRDSPRCFGHSIYIIYQKQNTKTICLASQSFPNDIQFLQIFLILIKILNLGNDIL